MTRNRVLLIVTSLLAIAALAYLRDPDWLIRIESGFRGWEIGSDGARYRWTGGHASFFVRSNASAIDVPIRTSVAAPSDIPVTVTLTIDDRLVDRLVLNDDGWHLVTVQLPPRGARRVRRMDIRVDRTKDGNRGVQVGEVQVR